MKAIFTRSKYFHIQLNAFVRFLTCIPHQKSKHSSLHSSLGLIVHVNNSVKNKYMRTALLLH